MRVPISWLKEYVQLDDITPEELAEKLTQAGFEVGTLDYIGVPQNTVEGIRVPPSDHLVWDRDKILLGAIREVKPHPDADRLVLAQVDYGGDELEQCVTGAPNLFDYVGKGELDPPLWTPFAKEGAEVYNGHTEGWELMTLKGRKLRGIYNKTMVLSEKELGISEAHEGIMLLGHSDDYKPGTPLQDVLGDVVLDIELTPNLGHGFSILGVAREAAALLDRELHLPDTDMHADGNPINGQAAIRIEEPELNPRFTLTLLRDTTVQPSPFWLRWRLKLVGQRPINNIVDVTNYITFELGQPLHAFDYDKLVERADGDTPTIITRLPKKGEEVETLDDVVRQPTDEQILVCDEKGVLSFGGLMGGAETEISDETTNVLLEAASWNFINIRKTAQHQKIFTEAGTRFSRNIHPSRALMGNTRGIEIMRQTGGGVIQQGVLDEYPVPPDPVEVELPIHDVQRLLGMDVSMQQAADVLSRLGFDITIDGDTIHAVTPDYRTDISGGVVGRADLVEEIVRIIGYDKIPLTVMDDVLPEQRANPALDREEQVRDMLVGLGLTENISYRFTTPEAEAMLTPPGSVPSLPEVGYVEIANPIASDKRVLRHTLLRNLLENAARNARFNARQQVFEIGSVYFKHTAGELPDELTRLAILMTGPRHLADWTGDNTTQAVDFFDMKGVVEELLTGLHITGWTVTRSDHSSLHPGRAAALSIGDTHLGDFGELHPKVTQAVKLDEFPVLVAELDLDTLIQHAPDFFGVQAIPTTPPVLEDIALVVPEDVTAAELEAVIRKAGGELLRDVRLFDVYTGDSIAPGKKSLTYSLTYQAEGETLTDSDVKSARKSIIYLTGQELGAELRS